MAVEHVVVLCLENRSFDHMLGYLDHPSPLFEGLRNGVHTNPDARETPVPTSPEAKTVLPFGPDHSHDSVMQQLSLAGPPWNRVPTHQGFVTSYERKASGQVVPAYQGLFSWLLGPLIRYRNPKHDTATGRGPLVMLCQAPEQVPVLSTLALEFAVLDHWYCSVPGETWPNRNYLHAATSDGETNIVIRPYDGPTIFDRLENNHKDWRIYHEGMAQAWAFPSLWDSPERHAKWFPMSAFRKHVNASDLPEYTFIEPNHTPPVQTVDRLETLGAAPGTSNSQHPENNLVSNDVYDHYTPRADTDFARGERLIATVYEALRANPELFATTVLVITYDEHGGLYDHLPATQRVPAPKPGQTHVGKFADAVFRQKSARFDFTRLGVRVPTVVVCPLVPKGTLDQSVMEHASVPATLREMFAPTAPPLNARDGHARTFHHLWEHGRLRTDLPDLQAYADPPTLGPSTRVQELEVSGADATFNPPPPTTPAYFEDFIAQAEEVRKYLLSVGEPEAANLAATKSVHDGDAVADAFTRAAERHRAIHRPHTK
jgi:phospholipase C